MIDFLHILNDSFLIKLLMMASLYHARIFYLLIQREYYLNRGELTIIRARPIRRLDGILFAIPIVFFFTLIMHIL